jgi:hypothetical protein
MIQPDEKARPVRILATVIPWIISIGLAAYAVIISLDTRAFVDENFGEYFEGMMDLTTDEQAAVEYLSETPVFAKNTIEEIAFHTFYSACNGTFRITCSNAEHYVYTFKRDGLGAEGEFWYQPIKPDRFFDPKETNPYFKCRFNNEQWAVCQFTMPKKPSIHTVYVRAHPINAEKYGDPGQLRGVKKP